MDQRLTKPWKAVVIIFTLAGLLLAANRVFYWNLFGVHLLTNAYLYFVLMVFLSLVFVLLPAKKGRTGPVPWYDVVLFLLTIANNVYLGMNAENIVNFGWDYAAPTTAMVASFIQWALVLEALRRAAGLIVFLLALAFSLYPMVAGAVPIGFLRGIEFDLQSTAQMHALGVESINGLPLQTAAAILIGFLFFGVVLQHTGGAAFFYDGAMSVFGSLRGGAAKVSVVSSAGMGMMSGSAVSNVLTTGPMTIPAMKKSGFSGRYAAGIEATASTGGTVTPPIMGAAAFLMVSFVGVPYAEIAIAAAIPALLYYVGIYTQVDAYSAKKGLAGMRRADLPKLLPVLVKGWPFIGALVGLLLLLVIVRNESQAPFQIAVVLILIAVLRRTDRLNLRSFGELLLASGRTIAEIIGIIAGVGLIVGGLSMTGVSLSLARELVNAVGQNVILILIAGAITCFVLGMGMTVSAVYVFLAIVMAPALIQLGVDPIAAHLFVIYWATVSYITPPVALAAFAAAGIAKEPPMQTAVIAMRLGAVKYIVPFAFALNPALVAQGPLGGVAFTAVMAILGVFMMGCAFEGWLIGANRPLNPLLRLLAAVSGLLLFAPEVISSLIGLVLGVVTFIITILTRPREAKLVPTAERVVSPPSPDEVEEAGALAAAGESPAPGIQPTAAPEDSPASHPRENHGRV